MNLELLKYLINKPNPYLEVWVFIYCNLDDNKEFRIPVSFLLSRFKTSRTTMQRIMACSNDWARSGQEVGVKWANNELIVNWLCEVGGQEVGKKWAKSGRKKVEKEVEIPTPIEPEVIEQVEEVIEEPILKTKRTKKAESNKLYPSMIECYNQFCLKKTNMGAKIDAHQGKSMKRIIEYLGGQVKLKLEMDGAIITQEVLETQVLIAWQYILDNWDKITGYYAEQIKLNQIDSNLPNLLMQIRNYQKNNKKNRDEKFASNYEQISGVSFE